MVRGVKKCSECRRLHQKCRREHGEQQPCLGCRNGGRLCSAPERVKPEPNQPSKAQQAQDMADMAFGGDVPFGLPGLGRENEKKDGTRQAHQALDELLNHLDIDNKFLEEVHIAVEHLVVQQGHAHLEDAYEVGARHDLLSRVSEDTKANIHNKLGQLEVFADNFARSGDVDTVEKIYLRSLQVHDLPAFKACTEHWKLLLKVANFYLEHGQDMQGEKYLKKMLALPEISSVEKDDIRQRLADLTKHSSEKLNAIFLSRTTSHGELRVPIETPFPPQHRMMRLGCLVTASPDLDGLGVPDILGLPPLHMAMVTRLPGALDMIHSCDVSELERRDVYLRTPLFFAFLFNLEAPATALLKRLSRHNSEVRNLRTEDRDYRGRTILAAGIAGGCPLDSLRSLVETGADVNPLPFPCVSTPLQSAVVSRRPDVVQYLLEQGARVHDVSDPVDLTVMESAWSQVHQGYSDVFNVLNAYSTSIL